MGATSLTRRSAPQQEEPRFAWSGELCGYLRLGPQPARQRPSSARTPDPNWRAMVFAAAAAVQGLGTMWSDFRIIVFDRVWSYGIRNPRPLACHETPAGSLTRPYAD